MSELTAFEQTLNYMSAIDNFMEGYTDKADKDRPKVRAEKTLNKQIQEMLRVGRDTTRRGRVMAAVEVIRDRVSEAYGVTE